MKKPITRYNPFIPQGGGDATVLSPQVLSPSCRPQRELRWPTHSHPSVERLAFRDVVEIRQVLAQHLDDVVLRRTGLVEHGMETGEQRLDFGDGTARIGLRWM